MQVRVRPKEGSPSLKAIVRRALLASILLSCLYSLFHLRALSHNLRHRDERSITLGLKKCGEARGQQQLGRNAAPAAGAGAGAGAGPAPPPNNTEALAARDALLAAWPAGKPRAAIVILSRNRDLGGVLHSMAQLERRFNSRAGYPYVFLNDWPHSAQFAAAVRNATAAPCLLGQVPPEHWSYPAFIDQDKAAKRRGEMEEAGVVYGGSESYRHMCRYFSGFFFRHPLLDGFDFYWRVEPAVDFTCDLEEDPFVYMQEHNVSYGWNIMVFEVMSTIPSLWPRAREFLQANPELVAPNNSLAALGVGTLERGETYNGCHFWSNFEIGRLAFFRSEAYLRFFEHLDQAGGFFYERWGDAPVHTIAAAALLPREQIHWFKEIGYQHGDWLHCPQEPEFKAKCECNPAKDVSVTQGGCIGRLRTFVGLY